MKNLFFLLLLLLSACLQQEPAPTVSPEIIAALQRAENARINNPSLSSTLLNDVYDQIKQNEEKSIWAKYYFIKAHVELKNSNFVSVAHLIDTAINLGLYEDASYISKVNLLNALVHEKLELYNNALDELDKVEATNNGYHLSPNDLLIVYLTKARIAKKLGMPYKKNLKRADELIAKYQNLNLGIYYSNKAYLSDSIVSEILYHKKSLDYFLDQDLKISAYTKYCDIASSYKLKNLDSALIYLQKADTYFTTHHLSKSDSYSEKQVSYYYINARTLYQKGNYEQCLTTIEMAIALADTARTENALPALTRLKSEVYFKLGKPKKAKYLADLAQNYRLTYIDSLTNNRLAYIKEVHKINEIEQENTLLKLNEQNQKLKSRLSLIFAVCVSLVLLFLISERKKIKALLSRTFEQSHKKDISILKYEEKIDEVHQQAKETAFPERVKLNKIKSILDSEVSNWLVFHEKYQHRFPNGEKQLRNHFAKLNDYDIQLLMCVHYGLSDDKTAASLNIKKESLRKRRQRLRDRLELSPEVDIKALILSIFE